MSSKLASPIASILLNFRNQLIEFIFDTLVDLFIHSFRLSTYDSCIDLLANGIGNPLNDWLRN